MAPLHKKIFSKCSYFFCLVHIVSSQSNLRTAVFRKSFEVSNPATTTLITVFNSPAPVTVATEIECASVALATHHSDHRPNHASAFIFKDDGTCEVGSTPPYHDEVEAVIDAAQPGSLVKGPGVYTIVGVKMKLSDIQSNSMAFDYYILLNEDQSFADNSELGPFTASKFNGATYTKPSPVPSFNGQYAMQFVNLGFLEYQLPSVKTVNEVTVMLWYNSGVNWGNRDFCFRVFSTLAFNLAGLEFYCTCYSTPNPNAEGMMCTGVYFAGGWHYTAEQVVPKDEWAYVGVSYKGATGRVAQYVNGVLQAEATTSVTVLPNMNKIGIGGINEIHLADYNLGYLASFELWWRELNAAEVLQAYEESTTVKLGKLP